MFYHFKIHKESDGLWAKCIELSGCYTQADTLEELEDNMTQALNLFLSEPEDSKQTFSLPSQNIKVTKSIKKVQVDPSVAFAMLMRNTRLKHQLTLKKMSLALGYKNINTYVKLEKPETANPGLKTLTKVTETFRDFPLTLLFE